MSDVQPAKITHRPLLDGTRGVMMCVVLGYHLDGVTRLPGAWVSMDFFFVLSGYLITTLLVREYEHSGRIDLRTFFRRRVRRLGPALLAVLAGVFVAAGVLGGAKEWPDLRGDGLFTLFYVANWHFIWSAQSYFSSFTLSPLRHAWSLAIEEQFYLVWPFVFLALAFITRFDKRKMLVGLSVALVASALWMRHLSLGDVDLSRAYYGTDTRGQGLVVGVMLALILWRERWDTPRARAHAAWIGTVAFAGLVAMMLLFSDHSRAVYTNGGFVLIAVTAAVFIFACARAEVGPLAWIFGNPVSRHFGSISYSFYLWHWPVIVFLTVQRTGLSPVVLDVVRVAIALVLAELTYWYLERPIHRQQWRIRRQGLVLGGAFVGVLAILLLVTAGATTNQPPTSGGERASGAENTDQSVMVLGDSLAWELAGVVPDDFPYRVEGVYEPHCDIVGQRIFTGTSIDEASAACPTWPERWQQGLNGDLDGLDGDPDAVVVTLGLRQLFDIDQDGQRIVVGTDEWETTYRAAVHKAADTIRAETAAPIFWLDVPCFRWEAAASNGEEYDAERLRVVNATLADVLASYDDVTVVPYADRVCSGPGGTDTDAELRPDGAHMTEEATKEFWTWLQPQVDGQVGR
ncbi:MAG: acyltransferase family protein [Aquihabitans sp.]